MRISRKYEIQKLDPRICNIALDANAVDCDGSESEAQVDTLLNLKATNEINFVIPGSVRREITHPNTPPKIQNTILPQIFSIPMGYRPFEYNYFEKVRKILQGNAADGKHDADATHLCEAAKYGGYFITHDQRIIKKRGELEPILGQALRIVTLAEFLAVYDNFKKIRPNHPRKQ